MTARANIEADTTLLRPAEVAERLRVSERTVYRLVESGDLHPTHVGKNRSLRISLRDLSTYIARA